ncbi:hypothetical protein D3C75_1029390 [compost metagenome]
MDTERLTAHHRAQQLVAVGIAGIQGHLGDAGEGGHLVHSQGLRPLGKYQLPGGMENIQILLVVDGPSCFC